MLKYFLRWVVVIMLIWIPVKSEAQSRPVVIAASDWSPYTSPDLKNGGFLTDIVTTAFRRVGYVPEVKFVPWKRGVEMTKVGEYDTLLGASYTEERTAYFLYPNYAWENAVFFFGQTGHGQRYTSLEGLCPATVGTFRGSFYVARLSAISCLRVEEVDSIRQNIQKLAAGRIDLFIDSKNAVDFAFQTDLSEYKDAIEPVQPAFERDMVYLVVSKQHPQAQQTLADFDRGIILIQTDGTYQQILTSHGITPIIQEGE